MISILRFLTPSRLGAAMMAAALVFYFTSGTLGGYEGGSFAQTLPTSNPAAVETGGTPSTADLQTTDGDGTRKSCNDIPEAKGGHLLGKIVPCLTKTIQTSASRMSRELIEKLRPLLSAFLVFVMMLFGVQVLQNEGQLQARAFVLLLKIGFCFAILAAIPGDEKTGEGGLIGTAYAIMAETQEVVVSTVGPDGADVHCPFNEFGDANTPMIWKQMDCLLSKIYGFTKGENGHPNMLLASSLFGMMGGFLFGGSVGACLFLACIGMIFSMFLLVLRVVVVFVNSYLFIAFYMILAPLLLPLMFLKVTTPVFEKWYGGILAALLLPLVICAYTVLAFQVYDKMFFAPDAEINKLFNNPLMNQARQLSGPACNSNYTNNPQYRADQTGTTPQQLYTNNPLMTNFINPLLAAGNNACGGLQRINLKMDGVLPDPNNPGKKLNAQDAFTALFMSVAKLFILSLLLAEGLKTTINISRAMLGSGAVIASTEAQGRVERTFSRAVGQARQNFTSSLQGTGPGTSFLQAIPGSLTSAGQGFLTGMGMTDPTASRGGAGGGSTGGATRSAGATTRNSPPPARGGSGNNSSSGGGGGSGGGGNDGPDSSSDDDSSTGSSSTTGRANPSNTAGAARASARTMSPADRMAAAQTALTGPELQRFTELERMSPTERRGPLSAEYDDLIDKIDGAQ